METKELAVFGFFYGFALTVHAFKHRRDLKTAWIAAGKSWRAHLAALCAGCASPATWEALQHYTIHLVVYSGKFFGH